METFKGWKTLIFAGIVALLGVLDTFDFTQIFTGENGGIFVSVVGIIIAFLRKVTNTAMGKSA